MKRKEEDFLGAGKQTISAAREKIITFNTNRKIVQCTKYSLYTMNSFMNL
jgi:hypothetical protein